MTSRISKKSQMLTTQDIKAMGWVATITVALLSFCYGAIHIISPPTPIEMSVQDYKTVHRKF